METPSTYDTLPTVNNRTFIVGVSPDTDVQTMDQQDSTLARKYVDKNMSNMLYAIAGTVLVLCILIHGCLFYRRWRLKRVRASVTGSPDRGWSWSKSRGKAMEDIESGHHTELDASKLHSISPAKSSPSSSRLDQDLNERRRSSTRIKVLPEVALSRSSSISAHSLQQKAEDGPDEEGQSANEDELSSNFNKGLKLEAAENSEASKGISEVKPPPDSEPCSEYELIQCGTAEAPNEQDAKTATTCQVNTVPTILQTQPSEEHGERELPNAGVSGVSARANHKDQAKELYKRRSYSFDNIPVLGAGGYTELQRVISATLMPGRGRSASESRGHSLKSPKTTVSFADATASGTSKAEPTYFTLIPDSELEPKHEKRYRTLPPVKSNDTANASSGNVKRKFNLSSFKISRKSKKSQKKKNKTPPSSPARSANQETSSAIYEDPEFPEEPNPATSPVYFVLEQPKEEKNAIRHCEENILSKDSKTGSKSSTFKNSPKNRIKSKGTKNIPRHKTNPKPENLENSDDVYEDLEVPIESTKVDEARVYDTLEPGPLPPPVPSNKNSGPIIGRTNTGAPLRQFQSARRELPSRPSQNVYDCIERGAFPSPGSKPRSQTLLPVARRGSSPSPQRFNKAPSAAYDSLCPTTLPGQLKAASVRRGSSPVTARREADAVYDLLNPDTFTPQPSGGSAKPLAPRPEVSPKPRSLRLPKNASLTYDTLHQEFQMRRGSLGTRPGINTTPKPFQRSNSLSKIQKGRPDISPKPLIPQGQSSVSTKPAVPRKPNLNGNTNKHTNDDSTNCEDPVYFTLNPNASSEPV